MIKQEHKNDPHKLKVQFKLKEEIHRELSTNTFPLTGSIVLKCTSNPPYTNIIYAQLWFILGSFKFCKKSIHLSRHKPTMTRIQQELLNICTQCRRYSAATIVVAYALIERLIVDITVAPPGMVNADSDLQNPAGSATCSITYAKTKIRFTYQYRSDQKLGTQNRRSFDPNVAFSLQHSDFLAHVHYVHRFVTCHLHSTI